MNMVVVAVVVPMRMVVLEEWVAVSMAMLLRHVEKHGQGKQYGGEKC